MNKVSLILTYGIFDLETTSSPSVVSKLLQLLQVDDNFNGEGLVALVR